MTSSLKSKERTHDLIVGRCMVFAAQVEAVLVDDLDAVVPQPLVPAIRADFVGNALADLIVDRRARQLPGVTARVTARALAAKAAGSFGGHRRLLGLWYRFPQRRQHLGHLVARHVVTVL